jgi:hypothetical protein
MCVSFAVGADLNEAMPPNRSMHSYRGGLFFFSLFQRGIPGMMSMGIRDLLFGRFRRDHRVCGQPLDGRTGHSATESSGATLVAFPVAQRAEVQSAEVSITLDGVRVFVHIGPTRATFAEVVEALESTVRRLQAREGSHDRSEVRKAA